MWEGLNPPYGTIVADPPWHFRYNGGGRRPGRPEGMGYSTMPLDEIKSMPVSDLLASDGWLLLWVTRDVYREGGGVAVARAWGCQPVAEIIWEKPSFGTGAFPRPCHEPLLIARRPGGRTPADRSTRSVQKWPPRNKAHSAKPPAAYDLAERHFPGPYLELFARDQRLGWDSWGHGYEQAVS